MVRRLHSDQVILLLAIAISAALLIPALFMDGMFMDGVLYTCVGKNLAAGKGSFWDPYFSATYLTSFHEQPPLKFALEAAFYRVLGNSFLTERIFCLVMSILTLHAMWMIWKIIWPVQSKERPLFWLSVLLFFTSPVTFYAFTNNVEEGTMVVFALYSAAFILRGIYTNERSNIWFIVGGVFLLASSLCKGFQGLFPLVIPMVWWLCLRNISFMKALWASIIVIAVPALFYMLVNFYQPAHDSYMKYFESRFYTAFNVDSAATTQHRFFLMFELLLDLLPAIFLTTILTLISFREKRTSIRLAVAFFLVGMAGILPLMVTLEQRGFYLVTGLPFVTTAIALLCIPGGQKINEVVERKSGVRNTLLVTGLLFAVGTIIATILLAGKPKRDAAMLADIHQIAATCGDNSIVSTDGSTFGIWSLQCYLERYHDISVSNTDTTSRYFIVPVDKSPPPGYSKVPLTTTQFHLYTK
jgi:hypothetical protein